MKNKIIVFAALAFLLGGTVSVYQYIATNHHKTEEKNPSTNEPGPSKETKEIFEDFYVQAKEKTKKLSLDEKIGQLLLARYDDKILNTMKTYPLGGVVYFGKDFKDKTKGEVIRMVQNTQSSSNIPLITAVDEEGGKVVRISSNSKLASSKFLSPSELYQMGGMAKIKEDTIEKSKLLASLGINVNFAPVADVATQKDAYMYERTLKQNATLTSEFVETVISTSKNSGVSYTIKHFPGYGNNTDTHVAASKDNRSYNDLMKSDILPFQKGIQAGAEAIMVSHNIVTAIDAKNPASLSPAINKVLRDTLHFSGVIITDALDMGALSKEKNIYTKALIAGNTLLIVTDYQKAFKEIKEAATSGTLTEKTIDDAVNKVLAWKYYKRIL